MGKIRKKDKPRKTQEQIALFDLKNEVSTEQSDIDVSRGVTKCVICGRSEGFDKVYVESMFELSKGVTKGVCHTKCFEQLNAGRKIEIKEGWNPRYLAYCNSNHLSPLKQLERDKKLGAAMTNFIIWLSEQKQEFCKVHNIGKFLPMNDKEFGKWLTDRWER